MLNVSPFALITIAPFVVLFVVGILASLGFLTGHKREARWLRKHMTIPAIVQQADQGLTPWLVNGTYVYMLCKAAHSGYEIVNPTSLYAFRITDDEQLMTLLTKWGYNTSWAANNKGTKPMPKRVRKGSVTEVDAHKLY